MIALLMACLLVTGAFGLGVIVASARPSPDMPTFAAPPGMMPPEAQGPVRGTFGAIDRIDGNVIHVRDPRSGRMWSVRAGDDTVIESGARRPIPFQALRPGQRVFVVGSPDSNELDAKFIGVVLGQGQRFVMPGEMPLCTDCLE